MSVTTKLETDVARVRAVAAALEGPLTVWVARYQNRHDDGFVLFISEAGARAQLLKWLRDKTDAFDLRGYRTRYINIARKRDNQFTDDCDCWYSIDTDVVNP